MTSGLAFSSEPARPAGGWPDAQRTYREAFDRTQPSLVALARWVDNGKPWEQPRWGGWPALLGTGVAALWRRRGKRGRAGAYVLLWDDAEGTSARPDLVVPVAASDLPSARGEGVVRVYGEPAPNGVLAMELEERLVFPIYNPQVAWGSLRRIR